MIGLQIQFFGFNVDSVFSSGAGFRNFVSARAPSPDVAKGLPDAEFAMLLSGHDDRRAAVVWPELEVNGKSFEQKPFRTTIAAAGRNPFSLRLEWEGHPSDAAIRLHVFAADAKHNWDNMVGGFSRVRSPEEEVELSAFSADYDKKMFADKDPHPTPAFLTFRARHSMVSRERCKVSCQGGPEKENCIECKIGDLIIRTCC